MNKTDHTFGPLTPSRHPGFVDFIEHVQSAIASGGILMDQPSEAAA
jgi:hypothetical protein